ncbi:hypothetical protein AKJ47_01805 [candidate division MSBL1 archaeon SCGC-AAA261G05]|uniref:OB domain-containing protein n=1 Tax=candidate division MSBL1 archaeon SCGC-AAA261G05 TaxID=1698276 RepID=A0A133VB36_9EURY|nr:hypothetical protein AKJ47_01805 [candidate division MSBL1 archaeon SCGC-AAA261G05]
MKEYEKPSERRFEESRGGIGEKRCPDCGAPLLDQKVCPECGADLRKRTSHKFAALICVVALAFGLGYYTYAGIQGEFTIDIGDIDEGYNYGYAWVEGTVTSGPEYRVHPSKRLTFDLSDGTGEISIRAYSEDADNLIARGLIPGVGDHVRVFGMMRVEDYGERIDIQNPEKFELDPASAEETTISQILVNFSNWKYERVTVKGYLKSMRPFGWMNLYKIENSGAELEVFFTGGLSELGDKPENLDRLYSILEITGGVAEYGGSPQLMPKSYADVKVVGRKELPGVIPLAETSDYKYELVGVSGKIVFSEDRGVGWNFWLDNLEDNSDAIPLWVWDSTYESFSENTKKQFDRGADITTYGEPETYEGEDRIELVAPPEISIDNAEGINTYQLPLVSISSLTENNVNDFVTVRGEVTQASDKGDKFTLENNAASIDVTVSESVWALLQDTPDNNDLVKVSGRVDLMGGNLVLYPGVPSDLEVVS